MSQKLIFLAIQDFHDSDAKIKIYGVSIGESFASKEVWLQILIDDFKLVMVEK